MKRFAGFAAALLCISAPAFSQDVSYSYIQAEYLDVDVDDNFFFDLDGDGYRVSGSVELGDNWFVFGDFTNVDFNTGVDLDQFRVGGGFFANVWGDTDWFVALSYEDLEASANGVSATGDGLGVETGLKNLSFGRLEWKGSISYVDFGDDGDSLALNTGLWYTVSGNFAIGADASFDDDTILWGVGARLYFDQ